ncbi:hypothetical protein QBC40DRAFT_269540 [Triangularia verruculosa]|uniref:Transmembrane protein n=1 Tax=Triangularia verruculosa TaxID=2587418 RepID=A0AAN7ARM8_9PEZI|nr:hypothetical protein QBC40DRAFT_269540 [Triangularia verruculosa]
MDFQRHQSRPSENQDVVIAYESDSEAGVNAQRQQQRRVNNAEQHGNNRPVLLLSRKLKPWYTARSILGIFCTILSLALLGLGIKLAVKYESAPLIHVTVAFTVFAAGSSLLWSSFEFIAMCTRAERRGIYPGAHVGVHMCLCLVCVAVVGYVGIWMSHGQARWTVEVGSNSLEYSPLYHMGIVILIISSVLLLVHFVLSILACQELRRKDDGDMHRTVVTVRYDGVGPTGTARPMGYRTTPETIGLPLYTARDYQHEPTMIQSPPIVIARGDLGVEIVETPSTTYTVLGEMEMEMEEPHEKAARSLKR